MNCLRLPAFASPSPSQPRRLASAFFSGAALALLAACATTPPPAPSATVWSLDQTAAIGGHPATVLGSPRVIRDATGPAVEFDGAHDGLVLPVVALAGLRAFTIELLIRPAADGAPEQRFFHTQDSAGSRSLLEIRLMPDGRWTLDTFLLSGKNSLPLLDRTLLHPSNQWHWVALRYDGRHMTSFVDGVQELAGEVDFPPMLATGQTSVGVRLNQVYWFKGAIRAVRIHPAALSTAQLSR
jgi:hypothetical protein